jgi:hypothetical protein
LEIATFDELSEEEQGTYVARVILAAINALKAQNRVKESNRVKAYFRGVKLSKGMRQLLDTLESARRAGQKHGRDGPPPLHIEDAMADTLKRLGVVLSSAVI